MAGAGNRGFIRSLPSWECGLKFNKLFTASFDEFVTPFVGVWIEITSKGSGRKAVKVTPFVGVWIEISLSKNTRLSGDPSLPSWECGLK